MNRFTAQGIVASPPYQYKKNLSCFNLVTQGKRPTTLTINCFSSLSAFCLKVLKKGMLITVTGHIENGFIDFRNGTKVNLYTLVAENISVINESVSD